MPKFPRPAHVAGLVRLAGVMVACTAASPSPSAQSSSVASAGPSSAPCAVASLSTKTDGVLTVGTDNPAFPPYFAEPTGSEALTAPWEFGDPTNGRGFESATAYALGAQLGFDA